MLTFLRKIRNSLIESLPASEGAVKQAGGSARKYFLYAIGEIALVVIGILIALQINNWNERRKDRIIEKQYLANLIDDLDGQINVCSRIIKWESNKVVQADSALSIIKSSDLQGKLDELNSLLNKILPRRTFTEYDATYEDLKSSGNLKLIKDQDLRINISTYYHDLKSNSRVFALNNEDLDANYKAAIIQNKFGFYRNPAGKLRNDYLKDPIIRQSLLRITQEKRKISNIHMRRNRSLLKRTQELKEQLKKAL